MAVYLLGPVAKYMYDNFYTGNKNVTLLLDLVASTLSYRCGTGTCTGT